MFTDRRGGGEATAEVKIPQTLTPWWVFRVNIILLGAIWAILFFFFGTFSSTVATLLILSGAIAFGIIAEEMPDFEGALVFDSLFNKRRVIFSGLNFKLPWEKREEKTTNLKRVVSSKGVENFSTNDPAENMQASLTVHMRVSLGGGPEEANDNFVRFRSIEEDALTTVVRQRIVKMFAAYYASKKNGQGEMENLLNPSAIQQAVLNDPDNQTIIRAMQDQYGADIGVELGSSNPDAETKKLKRTPARAEALATARGKLMAKGPNGEEGMTKEEATRAALLIDETAEFSEQRIDLDVNASGLENLHDVSFIPPGMLGAGKKGDKK